jgi:hypothetical protein
MKPYPRSLENHLTRPRMINSSSARSARTAAPAPMRQTAGRAPGIVIRARRRTYGRSSLVANLVIDHFPDSRCLLSNERSSILKPSMQGCDPMFFLPNGRIRLTASELNGIRSANARQGQVVDQIRTRDEVLAAVIGGLSPELVVDLLQFIRTGSSSRLTQHDATVPNLTRAGATSADLHAN